jgi:hypothetical protein
MVEVSLLIASSSSFSIYAVWFYRPLKHQISMCMTALSRAYLPQRINYMDNQNPIKQATANPLAQFYRKPGAYVTLPSGGRFYKNTPKLTESGELAVYPMTAKDELILKNPDALFNGEAVRQVLASVVPDIANINEMPSADVDMVLVAMRMASYGDDLNLEVMHGCEASKGRPQSVTVSLGSVIGTMRPIETTIGEVKLASGLTVFLRPYNLADQSRLLKAQFTSMRQLQSMENNDELTVEQKTEAANKEYALMVDLAQQLLGGCVQRVVLPDGQEVAERAHIVDWLKNLDRASIDRLDQELKRFQDFGIIREVTTKCDFCGETYKTDMLFDPTSFFTVGS